MLGITSTRHIAGTAFPGLLRPVQILHAVIVIGHGQDDSIIERRDALARR